MSATHPEWAVVLGGADSVWEDLLEWESRYGHQWDGLVIAANDVGSHWPRELDHWVSLHPHKFRYWEPTRQEQGLPNGYVRWGIDRHRTLVDRQVLSVWGGGSSGMLAVQVAHLVGCSRAILCGVPMTPTPHFAETQERFPGTWRSAAGHWRAWARCVTLMRPWVRSMSGRTRELLGEPTYEWLVNPEPPT